MSNLNHLGTAQATALEHAGAAITNLVMLITPPWLSAIIAGAELTIPNFHREVGRTITQANVQAAATQYRAAQLKLEARFDAAAGKLDALLKANPPAISTPVSEPPVYGPEPPPVYGPEAPERVSRPDPLDE